MRSAPRPRMARAMCRWCGSLGITPSGRGSADPHPPAWHRQRPRLTPNPAMVVTAAGGVMPFSAGRRRADPGDAPGAAQHLPARHGGAGRDQAPRVASYSFPSSFAPFEYFPGRLAAEARIDPAVRADLAARGHDVKAWPADWLAGSVEAVLAADRADRVRRRSAAASLRHRDLRVRGCGLGGQVCTWGGDRRIDGDDFQASTPGPALRSRGGRERGRLGRQGFQHGEGRETTEGGEGKTALRAAPFAASWPSGGHSSLRVEILLADPPGTGIRHLLCRPERVPVHPAAPSTASPGEVIEHPAAAVEELVENARRGCRADRGGAGRWWDRPHRGDRRRHRHGRRRPGPRSAAPYLKLADDDLVYRHPGLPQRGAALDRHGSAACHYLAPAGAAHAQIRLEGGAVSDVLARRRRDARRFARLFFATGAAQVPQASAHRGGGGGRRARCGAWRCAAGGVPARRLDRRSRSICRVRTPNVSRRCSAQRRRRRWSRWRGTVCCASPAPARRRSPAPRRRRRR